MWVIIFGYIGGCMIKFLKEIKVIDRELNNFYYFNDNCVLLLLVDVECVIEEGWWFKFEFIIN